MFSSRKPATKKFNIAAAFSHTRLRSDIASTRTGTRGLRKLLSRAVYESGCPTAPEKHLYTGVHARHSYVDSLLQQRRRKTHPFLEQTDRDVLVSQWFLFVQPGVSARCFLVRFSFFSLSIPSSFLTTMPLVYKSAVVRQLDFFNGCGGNPVPLCGVPFFADHHSARRAVLDTAFEFANALSDSFLWVRIQLGSVFFLSFRKGQESRSSISRVHSLTSWETNKLK